MKLLGCHIDNFGTFHDYDLSFNDGLNVIMQANGWGKTTLAAFVKAMLYGFDGKRVRNVAENERLRYKPWQGGKYGGSLDFEVDGREYRVVREFGATGAKDVVRIVNIETGKSVLSEIGEDVGEWLFGLDANAFQKSVFVVQNGFGFDGSMAGLRNRLNSLVNEADDVAGFDKAKAKLEERRKFYKKTGNRGAIADITKDIAKLVDEDAKADARIAELRRAGIEIEGYASSITKFDESIIEAQALAEKDQAVVQQEQALMKVGGQLRQRQQDAKAAFEVAVSACSGKVPTSDEIDEARRNISELERFEKEAVEAQASANDALGARRAITAKYPNGLPNRREVQDMRERVAGLAAREAVIAASTQDVDEGFAHLKAIVASDPTLIDRSTKVIGNLGRATASVVTGKTARDELRAARLRWDEKRKRLALLVDESNEKMKAVPADAQEKAASLQKDASELRATAAEIAKLEARSDALELHLANEREKLDSLSGGVIADASRFEMLDTAARAADNATAALNGARLERDERAARLAESKRLADDCQTKVDAQRTAATQAKPGSPASAIVCFAVAVIAAIIGVVVGPAGMVSFGLYAIGAVVAIAGAMLLSKRRPSAPDELDADTLRAAEAAKKAYEIAKANAEQAEIRLSTAENDARDANGALASIVGELFPNEVFDSASIGAQIPVLKQRLTARTEQEKRVVDAIAKLDISKAELEAAEKRAESIAARHPETVGSTIAEKASNMEARAAELSSLEKEAASAKSRMVTAMAEEMGTDVASISGKDVQEFLITLQQEEPPEAAALIERERAAKSTVDTYADELNGLLSAFGIGCVGAEELAVGAERLERELALYREGTKRAEASEQKAAAQAVELATERGEIASWAERMGVERAELLTDEWFTNVEADLSADEKGAWKEKLARERAEASQRSASELRTKIRLFFMRYGVENPENLTAELDGLSKRVEEIDGLKKAAELAEAELTRWLSENRQAVESATARSKTPQAQVEAAQRLELLRRQRDALVSDKAQREEQRNALLETLENRLAVQQELELLSKKRQTATANLFTIQKTSELLQKAREGLDGRYLGDLAYRFSDYANAWLENEDVEAAIDSDFGVALFDGAVAHDVAGYSTGYQDLLDICFRMALVDTVFQAEPPFLIMDDPFTSLDEDKIRRAFLLLETLSTRYQVIYFTCHPSRMEAGETAKGTAAFVLPEQHARRELPRARAKREAEERAKAQAELVASYAVVPVTGGRASISPQGRRIISSNLLNVEFAVDESSGSRDNSFEVHFIDGKGRVLCDRQTVEVMGGRTVPDKVRFSLSTRDDSGDTYDMIIHEDGREPAELAARIPYAANVSFASDDFGF